MLLQSQPIQKQAQRRKNHRDRHGGESELRLSVPTVANGEVVCDHVADGATGWNGEDTAYEGTEEAEPGLEGCELVGGCEVVGDWGWLDVVSCDEGRGRYLQLDEMATVKPTRTARTQVDHITGGMKMRPKGRMNLEFVNIGFSCSGMKTYIVHNDSEVYLSPVNNFKVLQYDFVFGLF